MMCRKLNMLPIECIVRGYITGSGWASYKENGTVCGIKLPEGLKESDKLPEPIYTPSTKAEIGDHDENISFEQSVTHLEKYYPGHGQEYAEKIRDYTIALYKKCAEYALSKGIIIADTKFEFGLDEDGKNLFCVEVDESIYVIEAGIKFPDNKESLGIEFIIQDFTYLVENKNRVAGIFITHGHDDVMGALPYLLQEVNVPIYTTDLTADLIDQLLQRYMRHSHVSYKYKIKRVNMNATIKVAGVEVDFFPITHSIPGSVGLAFLTDYGYIVYSSEFIIDFGAPERFRCNIQKMMEIGKKGVLALLCESSYSKNDG